MTGSTRAIFAVSTWPIEAYATPSDPVTNPRRAQMTLTDNPAHEPSYTLLTIAVEAVAPVSDW
jgi:hypothetical protein